MTRTAVPSTLHEYQEHVRKEALKIQVDMGWPDEKMNATLRALGLPEKVTFRVPVEVTSRGIIVLALDDFTSEEEARASIEGKTPEEMTVLAQKAGMNTGYMQVTGLTPLDGGLPTTFAVGDPDLTLSNISVSRAFRGTTYCETYSSDSRYYCTRPRGHEAGHAQGNGTTIVAAWDA